MRVRGTRALRERPHYTIIRRALNAAARRSKPVDKM
jgi:hypothetical protein